MVEKQKKIWFDGELIPWEDAKVHVLTHTLHYGLGMFEGIRCYKCRDGRSAIFRLRDHVNRLFNSAHVGDLHIRWTRDQVCEACLDTVRTNGLDQCYIRPLVFMGEGAMGLFSRDNPVHLTIIAWPWGTYLGEEGLKNGIRAKVSSFTRFGINSSMSKAKIVGNYVNSILAKREVVDAGYEEAVMLDAQGYVSEATGENIFIVSEGEVFTPPLGGSILAGITRDVIMKLCKEMQIPISQRRITRDELYIVDELFFAGTAAEITPVREIDNRRIGNGSRGPITERIQERYFQIVSGAQELHPEWLTFL